MDGDARERRDALIAAVLAGEAGEAELAEFEALRRADPTLNTELAGLRRTADAVAGLGAWRVDRPDDAFRRRVLAAVGRAGPTPLVVPRPRRSIVLLVAAACVACLVVGGAAGALLGASTVAQEIAEPGAPGELGALERVAFRADGGASVEGDLIAHTWGVETVLVADGLVQGEEYRVVVTDRNGRAVDSGTFIAAPDTVCRMNAAVLREDVARVDVVTASGEAVAGATVPAVPAPAAD